MTLAALQSRSIRGRLHGARCLALPLALLTFGAFAAPARADVGATIIERCTHGQSVSGFSQQDYRRALQELPAEVEEYSDCANRIRSAQLAAAGGGAGGGGEASSALALTPVERAALGRIGTSGARPVSLGGALIRPGVVHADVASALSSLPSPLLATLAFLLACALVLAGSSIRNRVRSRRSS
ncbi:MAG TPA: hypothetical protein VNZ05_10765 [Solirubrobacteraceae bacterium]|jgi:hypothetical protein|nr:hypothetical protein [Solirubrobacteraceae bacterium]